MHQTTSARPLPRPLPFQASRSTSALCPSLRAEAEVRPLPPTSAQPTNTHPMKGTPMTAPQEEQQSATLTSPELVTTIAAVEGFGRERPTTYHLAKGQGDRDWQAIWCGGGVLFPERAKVAPESVCSKCTTAKKVSR